MDSEDTSTAEVCSDEKIKASRDLVKTRPKNARVASQLACLLAEKANLEARKTGKENADPTCELLTEAIALARKATEIAPKKPFGFAALSLIFPDFDQRMKSLREAIELSQDSQHIFARIDLLVRLLVEPRNQEAKKVEGKVGSASSQHPSKRDLSQQEAVLYLTIRETLQEAWQQEKLSAEQIDFLAKNEYRLGSFFRRKHPLKVQQTRSKAHFIKAMENIPPSNPKHGIAQFWLATMADGSQQSTTVTRCPKDYVVSLYSTFASRFDNLLLESLKYVTPTELRRLVDDTVVKQSKKQWAGRALDLGCGTGLSGMAFRDCVNGHFVGVDLSPEMLEKAKERSCYDELIVGDCTGALSGEAQFDLITACDVFVYLGDLKETFEAAYASLSEDGIFAFSTELLEESKYNDGPPFILHECARFAHSKTYTETLAEETGFQICGHKVCPIRKNEGKDVQGCLVVLSKSQ